MTRTLADLPVDEWPGTRVRDEVGDEGEVLGVDVNGKASFRADRLPYWIYTRKPADLTIVETHSADDTTVECGTEEITGPRVLADLDVDDWPGCRIMDDGRQVRILTAARRATCDDYWISAIRNDVTYTVTYGFTLTESEAARTRILGRISDRGE